MKIKGLYRMPGSKFYWYRWTQGDRRRAVSLKTDDLAEAIQAVKKIQAGEFFARWERAEPVGTSVTRLVEDYLAMAQQRTKKPMRVRTAKTIKYILLKFIKDNRIESAREIDYQTNKRWLGRLKEAGKSADTLNKYAMSLRAFVAYLVGEKLVAGAEFEKFEIPERASIGRRSWLPMEVVNKVIAEAKDPELKFILYCGFHAGLRKSEIIATRVKWFDLEAGLLHVQNDPASGFILKDRENRVIPLSEPFKKWAAEFLKGKEPDEYAIRPEKGPGGEYRYDFKRAICSHFKRCGVTCTIHDMRRSFASNLVSRGVSIYKVARWLGDGVAVVERSYGHLAPADRDIDALSLA